ncbi:hypothetical protein SO694_00214020 [Aureococcus anophagefferens]|uniref:Uncharacterized protein n=1 Tax=Aureococcus anophagefferens TaxID=44056 RepID=A0ABR1FG36_AURAN
MMMARWWWLAPVALAAASASEVCDADVVAAASCPRGAELLRRAKARRLPLAVTMLWATCPERPPADDDDELAKYKVADPARYAKLKRRRDREPDLGRKRPDPAGAIAVDLGDDARVAPLLAPAADTRSPADHAGPGPRPLRAGRTTGVGAGPRVGANREAQDHAAIARPPVKSQYEIERDERIKRNEAFLVSLGLGKDGAAKLKAPKKASRAGRSAKKTHVASGEALEAA